MSEENEEKQSYLSDNCETFTDLEAAHGKIKDPRLAAQLKRMSKNYRKPPRGDGQLDIFMPALTDVATKDDISLMDIAVFGLGKKPRYEPIEYDLNDAHITVQGGSNCGMATIFDYDIFLYMVSYLTHEMNQVREQIKKGNDSYLPPRKIKPSIVELLKYCRRDDGGNNYKQVEKALERLSTTKIYIRKKDGSRRRSGMFSLIGDYTTTIETKTGKISELAIDIPEWIYDGVVRAENPAVLTINPDYFLLNQGYHRFLHRFARKTAGKGEAVYSLESLHERSGTSTLLKKFRFSIKQAIKDFEEIGIDDYSIRYEKKGKKENVFFSYIGKKP